MFFSSYNLEVNFFEQMNVIKEMILADAFMHFVTSFFLYVFLVVVLYGVVRPLIRKSLVLIVNKSEQKWDDYLLQEGVIELVLKFFPLLFAYVLSDLFFASFEAVLLYFQRFLLALIILLSMQIIHKGIQCISFFFQKIKYGQDLAVQSLCQVLILLNYFFGSILLVAAVMGVSPWALLSGLGALTAVLMLVFKDTLMGFVASIQLSLNRMLSVGDWIEMPQHGVDGNVLSLSLTNVKVQNWDKTISTLPTSTLVHEVVKNWKGMENSGGRRIKESLCFDASSVKSLDDEIINAVCALENGEKIVQAFKEKSRTDLHQLSNLSLFRFYVLAYLNGHDLVKKDMTKLLRILPILQQGIPLEFYFFISEQAWVDYEDFKADFLSFLVLLLPAFSLRLFQRPSSDDLRILAELS